MQHLSLQVTALSPLSIRADHSPDGAQTARYIPGTALAGCLAGIHRLLYPHQREEFADLFLRGNVSYPYLYPAKDLSYPVAHAPRTAQTCKKHGGFLSDTDELSRKEEANHGVRDSLFEWALFQLLDREGRGLRRSVPMDEVIRQQQLLQVMSSTQYCPRCQAVLKPFSNFYQQLDSHHFRTVTIDTHLQTRTGISREWGIVEEGILYNREVIEDNTKFRGTVVLADDPAIKFAFENLLKDIREFSGFQTGTRRRNSSLLHIGTGRTRGMGAIVIHHEEAQTHQSTEIQQRFNHFNTRLRTKAIQAKISSDLLFPSYFVLTLHSPLILHDEQFHYQGQIDPARLAEATGLPADHFIPVFSSARVERVTGWQELWGVPRTNELAIVSGSVFLFAYSGDQKELLPALFRLEEEGMGQRRSEGFGRIVVCDAFHSWDGNDKSGERGVR